MYFPIVIAKNYSVEMKDLVGTGAFLAVGVSGSLSHCWHISECRTSAFNLKNIPHVPFLAILRSGIKQVTNRPERAKHFYFTVTRIYSCLVLYNKHKSNSIECKGVTAA